MTELQPERPSLGPTPDPARSGDGQGGARDLPPPAPGTAAPPGPVAERPGSEYLRLALLVAGVVALGLWGGVSALVVVAALLVMIFLHELGHFVTARAAGMKVTEFFIGFGPRIWSFRRGEVEYGLKVIPAGAYVRIIGMNNLEEVPPEDEARTYRQKGYWRRLSVAVAGSAMHFLIALVLGVVLLAGWGQPAGKQGWVVGSVATMPGRDSPAQAAGLQLGDRIVAFNGQPVRTWDELTPLIQAHPGERVTLTVERDGQTIITTTTLDGANPTTHQATGFLGVGPVYPRTPEGLGAAVVGSTEMFGEMAKESVLGLGRIFSPGGISGYIDNLRGDIDRPGGTGSGSSGDDRLLSPIGAVQLGARFADQGAAPLLVLLIAINIFVGIFNLIPLLPFDGGHVAIATYEAVRSRKGKRYFADVTKMLPVTYGVVLILGLLFIGNLYLDITRPIGG